MLGYQYLVCKQILGDNKSLQNVLSGTKVTTKVYSHQQTCIEIKSVNNIYTGTQTSISHTPDTRHSVRKIQVTKENAATMNKQQKSIKYAKLLLRTTVYCVCRNFVLL